MLLQPWKEGRTYLCLCSLEGVVSEECRFLHTAWFESQSLTWLIIAFYSLDGVEKISNITFHKCNLDSRKNRLAPSEAAWWCHITFPQAVKCSSAVQQWALYFFPTKTIDRLLQSLAMFNKWLSGLSKTKFITPVRPFGILPSDSRERGFLVFWIWLISFAPFYLLLFQRDTDCPHFAFGTNLSCTLTLFCFQNNFHFHFNLVSRQH